MQRTRIGTYIALAYLLSSSVTIRVQDAVSAQTTYLPWSLTASIVGGLAFHHPNFIELPGLPNCCEPYTTGSGAAVGVDVGAELRTGLHLFDDVLKVSLSLGVQMLPSQLRQPEVVGNIINGTDVTDGTIEHQLDLSYTGLTIQPLVTIPLPGIHGLHLVVGGLGMLPLSTQVDQQQVLVMPSDPRYTFENGSRSREQNSGALPGATSPMLWAIAGVRYDVQVAERWTVSPMLRYQYGLTSLVSSGTWSVSSAQAGVAISYRLPKPEPPPIPPKEEAPPPPPPVVVAHVPVLVSDVTLVARTAGSREVHDTIFAPVITERITDTIQSVVPMLYFEQNSTVPVDGSDAMRAFAQALRSSMVDSTDQVEHVVITGSTSADEDPSLSKERISRLLQEVSVDQNHVTVVQVKASAPEHPEMVGEGRFVRVELGDRRRILHRYVQAKEVSVESVELAALHAITCEGGPCTTTVQVQGAQANSSTTAELVIPILLTAPLNTTDPTQPTVVSVNLITTDTTGQRKQAAAAAVVVRTVKETHRTRVWVDPTGTQRREGFLLALFEFNQVKPSFVDLTVIDSARAAIKAGRRVTIVPGTDEFGAADYNLVLRKRRAEAGRDLIGPLAASLTVDLDDIEQLESIHPLQRVVRRCVWIRIE